MKKEKMTRHVLSASEFEKEILRLCEKLGSTGKKWDMVIGVGKGGLTPAIYVSQYLNIPCGTIMARRYVGEDQEGGKIKISSLAWLPLKKSGDKVNVLVVDDIADKGITLHAVKDYLKNVFDLVDYAVIFYKPRSSFLPNYYVEEVKNDVWVQFPHEKEEW